MDYIKSVDVDWLKADINHLRSLPVKDGIISQYIGLIEKVLILKESLAMEQSADEARTVILELLLSEPKASSVDQFVQYVSAAPKKSKEKYSNQTRLAVASAIIALGENNKNILNEDVMSAVINNIKNILNLKKLHVKTVYDILGETNPYDDHVDRWHIFDVATLRSLEFTNQNRTDAYSAVRANLASHRKKAWVKVVGKIDLPSPKKDKPELKQEKTTNPLSLVWTTMTSRAYLQAYNLDTIDKVREVKKEQRIIPARIVNVTDKFVYLTVWCEELGWWNTRLFNINIPSTIFSQQKKNLEIWQIYPVQIHSVQNNRHKANEYFITGYLVGDLPNKQEKKHSRSTIADYLPSGALEKLHRVGLS